VFAASIDTPATTDEPDWRRISPDKQKWEPHILPSSIEELCCRFVQRYNLHFGAIDLILTPENKYFFLELNANGQWVWIEMITGMPMSAAMIDLLSKDF
jgi:glutathione synthase/RimK-type ligase-like ATP-grasp enzyme